MELKDLNYISFDLETTGLNTQKDEPIQIGLIKFNKNLQIIKTFKSYIKPQKSIENLKNIVSFVTGLDLKDLENAPTIQDLMPHISSFFDQNTVIIGHNVGFDIDILSRFIKFDYLIKIDTLPISKSLIHFLPSYSLEIIYEYLKNEYLKAPFEFDIDKDSFLNQQNHDAFFDAFVSYVLFGYLIYYIKKLSKAYPIIKDIIFRSDGIYKQIFDIGYKTTSNIQFFLPKLKKELKKNVSVYLPNKINLDSFENYSKFYIGNIKLSNLIEGLVDNKEKIILSFNSQQKLDIIKQILQLAGIKNFSGLYEEYALEEENIKKLVNKDSFQDYEINFLLKYFSQYHLGHSYLDINSTFDYRIFEYLRKNKHKSKQNIVLTTHTKLFEYLNVHGKLPYKIYFFDWDFWYQTYSKFVNMPFDIYFLIGKLENMIYKLNYGHDEKALLALQTLNRFYGSVLIFTGVFFSEITKKFIGIAENKIEISPILDDIDFYKTNKLYKNLKSYIPKLKKVLNMQDFENIKIDLENLDFILNNLVVCERKMYEEDKFYYVFYKNNVLINYQEFLDSFYGNDVRFFTNFDTQNSIKLDNKSDYIKNPIVQKIEDISTILSEIQKYNDIFILSTSKTKSKELFDILFERGFHKKYKILIENITGGYGKNIFFCQSSLPKIAIGGYDFVMGIFAKKIKFDKIIVHSAFGPMEKNIIRDINYYSMV